MALVGLVGYMGWLDLRVRREFDGRRWAVPAQIYARPLELYEGRALTRAELIAELAAAGYRRVRRAWRPGSYQIAGARARIETRAFRFWDATEPRRHLALELGGGRVARLRDASGRAVPVARIEPAVIGRIYPTHREDRVLISLDEVPEAFLDALVAVEDRDFWNHHGISWRGIARAAWVNLRAGAAVQGGSTLTQQLAKSFFLSPRRTLGRKLEEALIALILEARYDKRTLLEAYLNEVFLGQQGARAIHGFGLAARFYFGRRLGELDLAEAATLIALIRGPSLYNPRRHPERARMRRDLVLSILRARGLIEARTEARARARPLGVLARPGDGTARHPAFLDLVRRQLHRDYREADLRTRGLRIFTTLDPVVQAGAERVLARRLGVLESGGRGRSLQGAVVVSEPATGEVLAVVGSRSPTERGFNRALDALRPIGSLIKPVVYLTALEQGGRYRLDTLLSDRPIALRGASGQLWRPRNYDGRSHGDVPLYLALAHSYNLATVRLGLEVGLDRVIASLRALGVTRPLRRLPSLLLGSQELTPLEVTSIYQTLAAGGFRMPLRAIRAVTGAHGRPLRRYGVEVSRAAPRHAVEQTVRAMQAVMRVGTGRRAYRRLPASLGLAGKTGTTDGLRDSWFAGFDGARLAVVWVGRDDNRPTGLTGASGALEVWTDLFSSIGARRRAVEHLATGAAAALGGDG